MYNSTVNRIFLSLVAGLLLLSTETMALEEKSNGYPRVWFYSLPYPYLSHPVYDYLRRIETADPIPLYSKTQPYLAHQFTKLEHEPPEDSSFFVKEQHRFGLENMSRMAAANGILGAYFGPWRKLMLSLFGNRGVRTWFYGDGTHFLRYAINGYSERGLAVTIQPVYGLESIDTDDDRGTISRFTGGARVEGGYAGKLRFMVDFRDHTEGGNGPYGSRAQLYEDRWGSVDTKGKSSTSYNISESFLQYYGHDLSIAAGRGRHHWGPGQCGGLFLNSYAPPFDYIRFDAVLEDERSPRAVYYTFLHGWLNAADSLGRGIASDTLYMNSDGRLRTLNAEKYLSAQRLEVRPRANVLLGFSQGVVYGDRSVQLGYLTPLNFLYSVQHSNDDKDNFVLGFDGSWRAVQGLKLYGEAFFDDIVVGDLTKSTGNNKSAYTIGVHGIIPKPFWSKFDLRTEYTKIRPFVYSHIFAVNTYSHWTSPLGYTREPNSEFMTAELRGTFYPVQITLHWSRQNHGADSDTQIVGGSVYAGNFQGNDQKFPFLAGRFERTTRTGIRVSWEPLPNLLLFGEGMQIQESHAEDRFETRAGFGWNL